MSGELSFELLLVIVILLIYTITAPVFERYHIHFLHESGFCMLIGIAISFICYLINPEHNIAKNINFDNEVFFTFILPPIIFAAGYNLRRTAFFKYFYYIFLFGVIGTIINFCIMSPLTYIANKYELFSLSTANKDILNFSILEILLFCSVISSTDAVAALTFIKEDEEPKLFEILFGEAVINDAVCIVLYTIIVEFFKSGQEFNSKTPIKMMGSFTYIFICSVIIGALIGCLSAYFIKKLKDLKVELNRMQECAIIIIFAFISYYLTEAFELSPIISLLFCGIFMSQYTFYNLSFQAREESAVVTRIMSSFGEGYVFVFLGLSVNPAMAFSFSFFCWEIIFLIGGRIMVVYGISFVMEFFKVKSFNLQNSTKGIMTCSGWIRGAIAFGLAISIQTSNELNKYNIYLI